MDKYTVDLDKVLNDFEYSEYSLESAKLNRNAHEDLPNTSINSNFPNKNNTPVKHSINNVFHSLNEYLSTDITPKKIENIQKPQKNVNFMRNLQSSSYSEIEPNTSDISRLKILNNTQETTKDNLAFQSDFPNFFPVDSVDCSSITSNLVGKTVVSENVNLISEEISQKLEEQSTENMLDSNKAYTNIIESKEDIKNIDLDSVETEIELEHENESGNNEKISEEILIDLDNSTNFFDKNRQSEDKIGATSDVENNTISKKSLDSAPTPYDHAEINTDLDIPKIVSQLSVDKTVTTEKIDEVEEKKPVIDEEKGKLEIVTVKFEKDFHLDEENLDQYFEELEQELGMSLEVQMPDHENVLKENNKLTIIESNEYKNDELNIAINSEKNEITARDIEILEESKDEEHKTIEHSKIDEKSSESQVTDESSSLCFKNESICPKTVSDESLGFEIEEHENSQTQVEDYNKNSEMILANEKIILDSRTCLTTDSKVIVQNNEEVSSKGDEKSTDTLSGDSNIANSNTGPAQDVSECEKQDLETNSRPQHLVLTKENQEVSRKINLIGDPGSTPYNNVYSTRDFEKNNPKKDGSGESTSTRPVSPTYSDVSTDSVSSGTSNEAYDDAISEIHSDKSKKIEQSESQNANRDSSNEETVQNNMVLSKEVCKNDVTTGKDFKNNLKTNNSEETGGESSRSNVLPEGGSGDVENIAEKSDSIQPTDYEAEVFEDSTQNIGEACSDQSRLEESTSSLGIDWLGKQAPLWIPDNEAMNCLHCNMKFTVIKRRHHCRACGLVLCAKCCNLKYRLEYLDAEARVCKKCYDILNKDTNSSTGSEVSQESSSPIRNLSTTHVSSALGQPNPNNPLEYCSTIPPMQQVDLGAMATPSVMVPVGVLKRKGSSKGRSNKSVMFCDGIRPGSDLTNLDTDFNYSDGQKAQKSKKAAEKAGKSGKNHDMLDPDTRSFIPSDEKGLPPTVTIYKSAIKHSSCANNCSIVESLKNEPLIFALQSNVFVHVKIVNLDCCVNRTVWCFSTEGLINVGQDELVILLEVTENESTVPKDVFVHLNNIYLEAVNGSSVKELGLSLHTSSPFLGSKNHAGFVYIRPTFQCLQNVILPKEPYLIGVLIHRWETPWAKLFPLRLVLRLGAEYKYYPSPIISTRERDSVFVEIGHTIINLLADFRNFSYTLPQIRGLTIHMHDKNTTVTIPVNRYDQVMKGLSNSSDHILAFAGNFSTGADSHLVCIQDTQSATNNYSTHAINICNQPRKITGASFIVFNGALKSTSGLTAKSNIVEDGLMIQILPEHMLQVRESLKNMKNHVIKCGCVNEESDETVTIVWGEPDTSFNVGVLSPIDNKGMTGIPSIRVHNGKDYTCNSGSRLIRWTEVFILQSGDESPRTQEPVDISKISENIAKATCQALVKYLDLLISNSFYKIGLRANLHIENVSYSAGSNNVKLPPIYMKSLDNELIPVLHRITSNNITEQPIVLELIFRILNI